jgi:hypothetical protein
MPSYSCTGRIKPELPPSDPLSILVNLKAIVQGKATSALLVSVRADTTLAPAPHTVSKRASFGMARARGRS